MGVDVEGGMEDKLLMGVDVEEGPTTALDNKIKEEKMRESVDELDKYIRYGHSLPSSYIQSLLSYGCSVTSFFIHLVTQDS